MDQWPSYSQHSSLPYHEKLDTLGNLDEQPKLKSLLKSVKCLAETSGSIKKNTIFTRKLSDQDDLDANSELR